MENRWKSHGNGVLNKKSIAKLGKNVVFEKGVLVFHPKNIKIGSNVYIGHQTILKGYYENQLSIGNNVWIGQQCFIHAAGGLIIEDGVGIGPGVKIMTSFHDLKLSKKSIHENKIIKKPVKLERGCDIGVGSIILAGVTVGEGSQVGAGAVVTKDVKPFTIVAGVPAKVIRQRK